jgi:hypothetical protein
MTDSASYPHLFRPSKGYVFVVTYGRSGSTLTQTLLNSIPGYCIRGENANASLHIARMIHTTRNEMNFTERRERLEARRAGRPMRGFHTLETPQDPWYGAELLDPDRLGRSLFDTFVREVLHLPEGLRVGGFKEIRYVNDLRFLPHHLGILQEFFPGAKLILQTRAHAEVAKSGWWQQKDPKELARHLGAADAAFHSYRAGRADCFHLDYACYRQGAGALRPLFDFLDEPFDAGQVQAVLDTPLTHGKPGPAAKAKAG